jgi:hypothetical protein
MTGCIGPCNHCFDIFYVLDPRGIFSLLLGHINKTLEGWGSWLLI